MGDIASLSTDRRLREKAEKELRLSSSDPPQMSTSVRALTLLSTRFHTAHTNLPPKTVYKHYLRALSRWPKDALRPECQFQDVIRKRVDRRLLPSSPSTSTKPPSKLSSAEEKAEWEQVNALYSLLENRYSRKVCIIFRL